MPTQGGPYRAPETRLKYWPVEYNGQLPVWAALELRRHVDGRELTDVEIGVYTFCYTEIGSEPEKWDPKTRETADHITACPTFLPKFWSTARSRSLPSKNPPTATRRCDR
jgi:2-methylcitrate dehydratase PrpD